MADIPKLTEDLEIIQKLGDNPNVDDGLTAAQLKAKFDAAPLAIQEYINGILVPAVNDSVKSNETAASAKKLSTARGIRVDLGSEAQASFDGSADASPGVSGVLPLTHGGLGATTAAQAMASISKVNTGAWKTSEVGISCWKYENGNTTTYDIPAANCFILVMKETPSRGTAIAFGWASGDITMWRNTLHDDSRTNVWNGWTSPSMLTNLGSTTADSSLKTSPRPGVTGTLGVGNGGTGKTTAIDAANAFINALGAGTDTPKDADNFIVQYANGGTTNTNYYRKPVSKLWDYIKSKADSVYQAKLGFTPVQQGGGAGQSTNKVYLGWNSSGLKLQVDTTDLGTIMLESQKNMTLLWTNNTPNQAFAGGTNGTNIYFTDTGYDAVFFVYRVNTTNDWIMTRVLPIGYPSFIDGNNQYQAARRVSVWNGQITIYDAGIYRTYGTSTTDNNYLIPYKIYGVKWVH